MNAGGASHAYGLYLKQSQNETRKDRLRVDKETPGRYMGATSQTWYLIYKWSYNGGKGNLKSF
jgi:hypothetical protein